MKFWDTESCSPLIFILRAAGETLGEYSAKKKPQKTKNPKTPPPKNQKTNKKPPKLQNNQPTKQPTNKKTQKAKDPKTRKFAVKLVFKELKQFTSQTSGEGVWDETEVLSWNWGQAEDSVRGYSLGDGWNRSLWWGNVLKGVQWTQESKALAALYPYPAIVGIAHSITASFTI